MPTLDNSIRALVNKAASMPWRRVEETYDNKWYEFDEQMREIYRHEGELIIIVVDSYEPGTLPVVIFVDKDTHNVQCCPVVNQGLAGALLEEIEHSLTGRASMSKRLNEYLESF